MSGATAGLIAGVLVVLLSFVVVILSTLVGAVCGWVVGLTPLGGMALHALAGFGVTGIPLHDIAGVRKDDGRRRRASGFRRLERSRADEPRRVRRPACGRAQRLAREHVPDDTVCREVPGM